MLKTHFNISILDNKQYSKYIILKFKENEEDYHGFINSIDFESELATKYNINLSPYLYTLEKIDQQQYENFLIFYKIYLKKADIVQNLDFDNIVDFIYEDIVHMLTFIIAMQYYFL